MKANRPGVPHVSPPLRDEGISTEGQNRRGRAALQRRVVGLMLIGALAPVLLNSAIAQSSIRFEDATAKSGIQFTHSFGSQKLGSLLESTGAGCVWFDYNNDGLPDLYVASGKPLEGGIHPYPLKQPPATPPHNHLYRNNGDGTFTDVTDQAGVAANIYGMAAVAADYDNDGFVDLFVTGYGQAILYHNNGDGTFTDVTAKAGIKVDGWSISSAWLDYDRDGCVDLFVGRYVKFDPTYRNYYSADNYPGPLDYAGDTNRLYHNNCNGTFTDVTDKADVRGSGWSTSAAWVDLDNDGRLDLVVLRYVEWDFADVWCGERKQGYRAYCQPDVFPPISPLVYHNDGNGHFTEVSRKTGISKEGRGLGIAFADYDRDGHVDLFVANDSMQEFLYRNKGNGTFEEVGLLSEVAVDGDGHTYAGMGVDFADYNNDGLPDVVVTDLANQRYALYENKGDSTFSYASLSSGIGRVTALHSGWGTRFLDYDNDGWKDLLVAQGHDLDTIELSFPNLRYREPMLLARNTGHGFEDVSAASSAALQEPWVGRGMAVGDINNDGRVDAVVTTNDGPVHILLNMTTNHNHWLTLELVGHKSNRDAIGTEVKLVTRAGPQFASVTTASSYLSSSDKRVHFGLGSANEAESIEITWPSGIAQKMEHVRGDRIVRIDEPLSQKTR